MWYLNVATIRGPEAHVERVYRTEDFARGSDPFEVRGPVRLAFDVRKDQERFHLIGRVEGTLDLPCSRCLEPFALSVDTPFDLRYEPRPTDVKEGEREVREQDFSTAYYDDQQIDLGQLLSEQFHLAVPMKPLCTESCRGLCPLCGANLNRESCGCVLEREDPRLAVLKGLAGRARRDS